MKKSNLMPTLVLGCICLASALLLSVINTFTSAEINGREDEKATAARTEVLPGGSDFEKIELDESYPKAVLEAQSAKGGFVFRTVGKGRNGDVVIMVGVDTEGRITGTKIISEGESKGYKERVYNEVVGVDGKYTGQTLDSFSPVTVGGATMTSNAFAAAIEAALQGYAIASGAGGDFRTPEQILQDRCNAALGTEGKTFTKWFAYEVLNGVSALYQADDGCTVVAIGDSLVGVNASGEAVYEVAPDESIGEPDAEIAAIATEAHSTKSAASYTEVDVPDGLSAAEKRMVKAVYRTASGNYVLELEAEGYSAQYSGPSIKIKVAISRDGAIISVITTEHAESKGYGDVCATEEYYKQYEGKTDDDVRLSVSAPDASPGADQITSDNTDVGVIASATCTTYGYQRAIKAAFAAYKILTGGEA